MCLAMEIIICTIVVFQQDNYAGIVVISAFCHNLRTTAIILLQKNLIVINGNISDHRFNILCILHRRSQIYNQKAHRQSAQIIMQAYNHLIISKLIKPKIHFWVKRMWI